MAIRDKNRLRLKETGMSRRCTRADVVCSFCGVLDLKTIVQKTEIYSKNIQ